MILLIKICCARIAYIFAFFFYFAFVFGSLELKTIFDKR